jgi:hypothetical protein
MTHPRSIAQPLKKYWTNLIIETEQAIKLLDVKMQQPFRILATKKLKQILAADNHRNTRQKRQAYTIKNINDKLVKRNAILVKADEGKQVTILIKYILFKLTITSRFYITTPQTSSKNY